MARRGRRSKLTPRVQKKILEAIRLGATYEVAARAAGIGERTLYRWKERGQRAKRGKFRQFWQALQQAEAEGEIRHLQTIAEEGPSGSKWILERRYPDRWGRRDRVKHETDFGDALAQVLERLAHRGRPEDD